MNKTKPIGIMLSTLLLGSSILFVSLVSENKVEATVLKDNEEKSTPCQPPCIDEAKNTWMKQRNLLMQEIQKVLKHI